MGNSQNYKTAIDLVKLIGNGRFNAQYDALMSASFVNKPFFFPFKNFNTTIGETIFLSKEFYKNNLSGSAATLCHEATHLLQYQRWAMAATVAKYAQKVGRWEMEKESYGNEIIFRVLNGNIHKPQTSDFKTEYLNDPHLTAICNWLLYSYYLGDIVNGKIIWDFFEETVRSVS